MRRVTRRTAVSGPRAGGDPLAHLLLRSARGDEVAFAEVYDLMASRVHGITLCLVVDPEQAAEVTQQVFVEVWRRAATFDGDAVSARGWITSIAHTRAVERARSSAPTDRAERGAGARTDATDEARAILDALDELTPPQRRAIELAYFAGSSSADIAVITGASVSTTRAQLTSALLRLCDLVGQPRSEPA